MSFRSIIPLLIIASLFSCTKEDPKSPEMQNMNEMIFKLDNENRMLLARINKEVQEEGGKPREVKVREQAEAIIKWHNFKSLDSIEDVKKLDNQLVKLAAEFKKTEEYDSTRVKRSEYFLEELKKHNRLIDYKNFIISYLLIEKSVLQYYATMISGGCRFFDGYSHISKYNDTVKTGDPYSFAVVPSYYSNKLVGIMEKPTLVVSHEGRIIETQFSTEDAGWIMIFKTTFKEKGKYKITGNTTIKALHSDYNFKTGFVDSVYVE